MNVACNEHLLINFASLTLVNKFKYEWNLHSRCKFHKYVSNMIHPTYSATANYRIVQKKIEEVRKYKHYLKKILCKVIDSRLDTLLTEFRQYFLGYYPNNACKYINKYDNVTSEYIDTKIHITVQFIFNKCLEIAINKYSHKNKLPIDYKLLIKNKNFVFLAVNEYLCSEQILTTYHPLSKVFYHNLENAIASNNDYNFLSKIKSNLSSFSNLSFRDITFQISFYRTKNIRDLLVELFKKANHDINRKKFKELLSALRLYYSIMEIKAFIKYDINIKLLLKLYEYAKAETSFQDALGYNQDSFEITDKPIKNWHYRHIRSLFYYFPIKIRDELILPYYSGEQVFKDLYTKSTSKQFLLNELEKRLLAMFEEHFEQLYNNYNL